MKFYPYILLAANIILAVAAGWHALLLKRDPRASMGWIAVIFIFPLMGPFLYFLFGINRVRTRAKKLSEEVSFGIRDESRYPRTESGPFSSLNPVPAESLEIAKISGSVSKRPLVGGNEIQALHNGEEAFPAMLKAIEEAKYTAYLSTYIFETNITGRQFIDHLAGAMNRGVDVRVIIDGVGQYYSFPTAGTLLKRQGVRVARFIPPRLIPPAIHINLRNHRKILTVDSRIGFVGGMNIGDRHLAGNLDNPSRVVDMQFCLKGPIIGQMEEVFLEDWRFCTGDPFDKPVGRRNHVQPNGTLCRAIADGPNEDFDKFAQILVGVVSSARQRILIMTPYFLPSRELISALRSASLRGVDVKVVLPIKNNLPFIHWATRNLLWELLERGIRIFYQPPPFVHTKLLVVDDFYAHVGSANIDPRSLRLNFELTVEVYDKVFAETLTAHFEKALTQSTEVFLKDLDSRPLAARTRDALAWLFSPYL
ncbi:MAG: cardiolipin synthase [Deltaproteobacteria bacterium]|nr:cardiolipin synthase [Deltaproteobacteria bacterium]